MVLCPRQMELNGILHTYLVVAGIAFGGASIVQIFFPHIAGGTIWGLASGWQREIGFRMSACC